MEHVDTLEVRLDALIKHADVEHLFETAVTYLNSCLEGDTDEFMAQRADVFFLTADAVVQENPDLSNKMSTLRALMRARIVAHRVEHEY